jgi:hypothetical protein
MYRSFSREVQDQVRAERAKYFKLQKGKVPADQDRSPPSTSNTQLSSAPTIYASSPTTDFSTDSSKSNDMSSNTSSNKRFKSSDMSSKTTSAAAPEAPIIVRFYDPVEQAKGAHDRTLEYILSWPDGKLESCHNYIQMLFPVPEGSAFNWEAPIINRETMDAFRSRSELRQSLRRSFARMIDFYGFEITYQYSQKGEKDEAEKKNVKAGDDAGAETVKRNGVEAESSTVNSDAATTTAFESEEGKKSEVQDSTKSKPSPQNGTPSFPPAEPSNNIASLDLHIIRAPHWSKSFNNWVRRFDHNHLRITRILRCLRILGLQKECDAFFAALNEVYDDPKFNISGTSMDFWTRAVTRPLYTAPDNEVRVEFTDCM